MKQFFVPMVARAFSELGLAEREIIEYVSTMLTGFARMEHLYRVRSVEGKPIETVVEMLAETLDAPVSRASIEWQREVRQYVGDYTLFMSGLFRSYVARGGYLDLD